MDRSYRSINGFNKDTGLVRDGSGKQNSPYFELPGHGELSARILKQAPLPLQTEAQNDNNLSGIIRYILIKRRKKGVLQKDCGCDLVVDYGLSTFTLQSNALWLPMNMRRRSTDTNFL